MLCSFLFKGHLTELNIENKKQKTRTLKYTKARANVIISHSKF